MLSFPLTFYIFIRIWQWKTSIFQKLFKSLGPMWWPSMWSFADAKTMVQGQVVYLGGDRGAEKWDREGETAYRVPILLSTNWIVVPTGVKPRVSVARVSGPCDLGITGLVLILWPIKQRPGEGRFGLPERIHREQEVSTVVHNSDKAWEGSRKLQVCFKYLDT